MNREPTMILVVDDEPDIRDNLQDILQDQGYQVDTAQNGFDALQQLQKKRYDVALLDYKMPGMDGLTLYHRIREQQSNLVAIMISAYASPETTEKALSAGASFVLSKPVDLKHLLKLVAMAAMQSTVMVVDDDVALCDSLRDLLRQNGYRVCICHDESTAIEQVKKNEYDIVLVDWRLDHGSGINVINAIHQFSPQTASIMITANHEELLARSQDMTQIGADAICQKPFNIPEMLTLMKTLSRKQDS